MNIKTFSAHFFVTMLVALAVPFWALAQGSGYVWANNPTASSYTPSTQYSYNSTGGAITITQSSVGVYRVQFSALGGDGQAGGNVQVTAYGSGSETSKVVSWNSGGADFVVNVHCFTASGNPVNTRFSLYVVWPPIRKGGYVWANNPTASSYTPSTQYSFNSIGGAITITRSSVGVYQVRFSGLGGDGQAGGNVQVTAYGSGSETSKVVSWNSGGADFVVNVHCFTASGNPVNTRFSLYVLW